MGEAALGKKNGKYPAQSEKVMPSKPTLSHFTAEDIIPMFSTKAAVELAGDTVVPLGEKTGFLRFTDDNGGTAYLIDEDTDEKLLSFSVHVTDEMRQSKCAFRNCKCSDTWDKLLTGCAHKEHEDFDPDYLVPVQVYASLCNNPACTEQHVWLLSACIDSNPHHNNHCQIL